MVGTRFESIQQLMKETPFLLTFTCATYTSAFLAVSVSNNCICTIRIMCIVNLTFVEDHLDETLTRYWASALPIMVSASACISFAYHNDVTTGTAVSLLTNSAVPTGDHI